jgi:hypothetical protein
VQAGCKAAFIFVCSVECSSRRLGLGLLQFWYLIIDL